MTDHTYPPLAIDPTDSGLEPDPDPADIIHPAVWVCAECNGYGWVLAAPDATDSCDACRGSGYILEGDQY